MNKGIPFLGYKIFYYYKLLRKRNKRKFEETFKERLISYSRDLITKEEFIKSLKGWFGYAVWANTFRLRKRMLNLIN